MFHHNVSLPSPIQWPNWPNTKFGGNGKILGGEFTPRDTQLPIPYPISSQIKHWPKKLMSISGGIFYHIFLHDMFTSITNSVAETKLLKNGEVDAISLNLDSENEKQISEFKRFCRCCILLLKIKKNRYENLKSVVFVDCIMLLINE